MNQAILENPYQTETVYKEALDLVRKGDEAKALEILRKIDLKQLSDDERVTLQSVMTTLERKIITTSGEIEGNVKKKFPEIAKLACAVNGDLLEIGRILDEAGFYLVADLGHPIQGGGRSSSQGRG